MLFCLLFIVLVHHNAGVSRMKNLYQEAQKCFLITDPDEKLEQSLAVASAWEAGNLEWQDHDTSIEETIIQYQQPGHLDKPEIVPVNKVKNRGFKSAQQRASLIHALAHIELTAVNLSWDSVYRYRDLPKEYYDDWVQTAKEEVQHFYLLRTGLRELGFDYGDFPAHNELWQMAVTTANDLMARMAIVHRVLEARALDVVPISVEKFRSIGDQEMAKSLEIIANDEVGHVNSGSRWFRYCCAQQQVDPESTFFKLLKKYLNSTPRGPFNQEARIKAGFSLDEMKELERLDFAYKEQKRQERQSRQN